MWLLFASAAAAFQLHASCTSRSAAQLTCNANVKAPELVALTAADVRSRSMNELEELIEVHVAGCIACC